MKCFVLFAPVFNFLRQGHFLGLFMDAQCSATFHFNAIKNLRLHRRSVPTDYVSRWPNIELLGWVFFLLLQPVIILSLLRHEIVIALVIATFVVDRNNDSYPLS